MHKSGSQWHCGRFSDDGCRVSPYPRYAHWHCTLRDACKSVFCYSVAKLQHLGVNDIRPLFQEGVVIVRDHLIVWNQVAG